VSTQSNADTPARPPALPQPDLAVDFGKPEPGSANPMPEDRREKYEQRIRSSLDAQAAGAAKASKLFIR
jgi:hypothetical protein